MSVRSPPQRYDSYANNRARGQRGQISFITGQEEQKQPEPRHYGIHDISPIINTTSAGSASLIDTNPIVAPARITNPNISSESKYISYNMNGGPLLPPIIPAPSPSHSVVNNAAINYSVDSMVTLLFDLRSSLTAEQEARRRLEAQVSDMRATVSSVKDYSAGSDHRALELMARIKELELARVADSRFIERNDRIDDRQHTVDQQYTTTAITELKSRMEEMARNHRDALDAMEREHERTLRLTQESEANARIAMEDRMARMTETCEARLMAVQQQSSATAATNDELQSVIARVMSVEQQSSMLESSLGQMKDWSRSLGEDSTHKQDWIKAFLLEHIAQSNKVMEARILSIEDALRSVNNATKTESQSLRLELAARLDSLHSDLVSEIGARDAMEGKLQNAIKHSYTTLSASIKDTIASIDSRLNEQSNQHLESIESVQSNVSAIDARTDSIASLETVLRAEIKTRMKSHTSTKARIESVEAKLAEMVAMVGTEDGAIKSHQAKQSAISSRLAELTERVNAMKGGNEWQAKAERAIESLSAKISHEVDPIKQSLSQSLQSLTQRLESLTDDTRRRFEQFEDVKRHSSAIDSLQRRTDAIDELKRKADAVDECRTRLTAIERQSPVIDELRSKVSIIDDLRSKVSAIDELRNKVSVIDDLKSKVSAIDDIRQRVVSIDDVRRRVDSIEDVHRRGDTALLEERKLAELVHEVKRSLSTAIDEQKRRIDTIESNTVKKSSSEIEDLKRRIDECHSLSLSVDRINHSQELLSNELKQKYTRVEDLLSRLEKVDKDHGRLVEDVSRLRTSWHEELTKRASQSDHTTPRTVVTHTQIEDSVSDHTLIHSELERLQTIWRADELNALRADFQSLELKCQSALDTIHTNTPGSVPPLVYNGISSPSDAGPRHGSDDEQTLIAKELERLQGVWRADELKALRAELQSFELKFTAVFSVLESQPEWMTLAGQASSTKDQIASLMARLDQSEHELSHLRTLINRSTATAHRSSESVSDQSLIAQELERLQTVWRADELQSLKAEVEAIRSQSQSQSVPQTDSLLSRLDQSDAVQAKLIEELNQVRAELSDPSAIRPGSVSDQTLIAKELERLQAMWRADELTTLKSELRSLEAKCSLFVTMVESQPHLLEIANLTSEVQQKSAKVDEMLERLSLAEQEQNKFVDELLALRDELAANSSAEKVTIQHSPGSEHVDTVSDQSLIAKELERLQAMWRADELSALKDEVHQLEDKLMKVIDSKPWLKDQAPIANTHTQAGTGVGSVTSSGKQLSITKSHGHAMSLQLPSETAARINLTNTGIAHSARAHQSTAVPSTQPLALTSTDTNSSTSWEPAVATLRSELSVLQLTVESLRQSNDAALVEESEQSSMMAIAMETRQAIDDMVDTIEANEQRKLFETVRTIEAMMHSLSDSNTVLGNDVSSIVGNINVLQALCQRHDDDIHQLLTELNTHSVSINDQSQHIQDLSSYLSQLNDDHHIRTEATFDRVEALSQELQSQSLKAREKEEKETKLRGSILQQLSELTRVVQAVTKRSQQTAAAPNPSLPAALKTSASLELANESKT